jgi:hypothetical protein
MKKFLDLTIRQKHVSFEWCLPLHGILDQSLSELLVSNIEILDVLDSITSITIWLFIEFLIAIDYFLSLIPKLQTWLVVKDSTFGVAILTWSLKLREVFLAFRIIIRILQWMRTGYRFILIMMIMAVISLWVILQLLVQPRGLRDCLLVSSKHFLGIFIRIWSVGFLLNTV